jgi:hypothetical protein
MLPWLPDLFGKTFIITIGFGEFSVKIPWVVRLMKLEYKTEGSHIFQQKTE